MSVPFTPAAPNFTDLFDDDPPETVFGLPSLDDQIAAVMASDEPYRPEPIDPNEHFHDVPAWPRPGDRAMRAGDLARIEMMVARMHRPIDR